MLAAAGFESTDEFIIASAASELATNILRFAGSGELDISIIRNLKGNLGIELFASDSGPGIRDIEKAMQDQYSTLKNSLGLGLPSVKRIMDEFTIESFPGKGTRVLARKGEIMGTIDCAVAIRPFYGHISECGDTGKIFRAGTSCFLALIDVWATAGKQGPRRLEPKTTWTHITAKTF
jgi:serine/threonine-protein kinase RsbT